MKHIGRILFCSLLASASVQAMACYTVYDGANRVLYQGEEPPVDMSLPIHETVPARFPGGHMVFDTQAACTSVVALRPAPVVGGTPLLTNQQSAQAMRLPYTSLGGGIALVQPSDAALAPGLTVVPADPTRMMGAGPAPRR